jgi:FtsH-binding integral membrane protein
VDCAKEKGEKMIAIFALVWLAIMIGYVLNIIGIINGLNRPISGLFVLRIVGLIAFPIGGILGYIKDKEQV